jgi:hypothetical protein
MHRSAADYPITDKRGRKTLYPPFEFKFPSSILNFDFCGIDRTIQARGAFDFYEHANSYGPFLLPDAGRGCYVNRPSANQPITYPRGVRGQALNRTRKLKIVVIVIVKGAHRSRRPRTHEGRGRN